MFRGLFQVQRVAIRRAFAAEPSAAANKRCSFFSTSSLLDQFRDTAPREKRMAEPVGRSWSVAELRRKSFPDLHKLWFVLYKERNMLYTEKLLSRRKGIIFPQPERIKKIQKSMGAVRHVLGERKRDKLASLALASMEDNGDYQPLQQGDVNLDK